MYAGEYGDIPIRETQCGYGCKCSSCFQLLGINRTVSFILYTNHLQFIPPHLLLGSDHASWSRYGFRSAIATEGDFSDISPWIHGSDDDVSHVDFDHMKQFAKLSLGFAIELGHFSGKEQDKLNRGGSRWETTSEREVEPCH